MIFKVLKYLTILLLVNMYIPFILLIELNIKDTTNHGPYLEGLINLAIILVHAITMLIVLLVKNMNGSPSGFEKTVRANLVSNCIFNGGWLVYSFMISYVADGRSSIFMKYSITSCMILLLYFCADLYVSIVAFTPKKTQ